MGLPGWSFTQARMISQMTSNGASVLVPSGLACVDDTLYPARHNYGVSDCRALPELPTSPNGGTSNES